MRPSHSLHASAVHPVILTVRCAYKSFERNLLILRACNGTFEGLIQRTCE
jgi:hypothetical protein